MQAIPPAFETKLEALSLKLERRAPVVEQIADSIRRMIVAGDLQPGDRIVESRIARQIGVGQPTVREALVTLEHQGLVVRKANQGCVVTSFTRTEIGQMLRIREELETLAVDLAIESAAESDLRQLLDLTVAMKEAARARDLSRFFDVDVQFHETLWRLSGNSLLPRLLSQVLAPLLAFLFLRNLRQHRQLDLVESAEAHVELAEAILGRNRERARAVAREKFAMFAAQHLGWYEQ